MRYSKKRYVGIIALVIVLGFIFVNSMFDWNTSMIISELPKKLVYSFVSYGDYKWLDNFVIHQIRGFTHFFEFFVLGLIVIKVYLFKEFNFQRFINAFFLCFAVALLDETIQIFNDRHARVFDIWIDLLGVVVACFLFILALGIKNRISKKDS